MSWEELIKELEDVHKIWDKEESTIEDVLTALEKVIAKAKEHIQ